MVHLRDRMIEDMRLRDFSPKTQQAYLGAMASLVRFHDNRPPGRLTDEDIRAYFLSRVGAVREARLYFARSG